jgi:hypothetical protein
MGDDSKSYRNGLVRLILGGIVLGSFGAAFFISGWNGLSSGEITVYRKLAPSFVAYANGPHATQFIFEIAMRLVLGGAISLLGFGMLAIMLFASPEKRNRAVRAAGDFSRAKRGLKIPWWLTTIVFLVLFGLFLRAISSST